jgi:hypothetical protein
MRGLRRRPNDRRNVPVSASERDAGHGVAAHECFRKLWTGVTVKVSYAGTGMSATDDEKHDHAIPTEEIFLELQELEGLREAAQEYVDENEPTPAMVEDDPSSIKARIARLRAMLMDRGAPLDE